MSINEEKREDINPKSAVVTGDDLFRRSSQYQLWSFTREQLEEVRLRAHEKGRQEAIEKFKIVYEKNEETRREVFLKYPSELCFEALLDLVTFEEETKYLTFQTESIIKTANFFRMPTQVKAAAVSFFKRFYLYNSVMQYHPRNVLLTCIFLAAKSENYFISIESFCKSLPKTEPKDVLDLEFTVLQALKFTLFIHSPFRSLYGFFLDFQAVLLHTGEDVYDISVDTIGKAYDKGKNWLNTYAFQSSIEFLFTPPQIALTALYDVDQNLTERYLKKKFLESNTLESTNGNENERRVDDESRGNQNIEKQRHLERLLNIIKECMFHAKETPQTNREESIKTDRKCFFVLHPQRLIDKKIKQLEGMNAS